MHHPGHPHHAGAHDRGIALRRGLVSFPALSRPVSAAFPAAHRARIARAHAPHQGHLRPVSGPDQGYPQYGMICATQHRCIQSSPTVLRHYNLRNRPPGRHSGRLLLHCTITESRTASNGGVLRTRFCGEYEHLRAAAGLHRPWVGHRTTARVRMAATRSRPVCGWIGNSTINP